MLRRFIGLCVLVLAIPALAGAQSLEERVTKLEEGLTKLSENVTELGNQFTEQLGLQQQIIAKLRETTEQLNEQDTNQQLILDQISTTDSSSGKPIPRLSANMKESAEFKRDVHDAVHNSLKRKGGFSIENKLNSYQRIFVNKKEYGISARETLTLKVPVGTVTTQIPGRSPQNWTLGAPNYKESIKIVPSQSTVVYRPVFSTVVYPQVYNSPVYYYPSAYVDSWWIR